MIAASFPFDCLVGLAVAGAEVTVPGYQRELATLVYTADGVTVANTASIAWPHATAPWGAVDGVQLWSVTGALLALFTVAPISVGQYDSARIPAGGIAATYGGAPRPYGVGKYGAGKYGVSRTFGAVSVVLERAFEQPRVCAPGLWTPGPFSMVA